MLNIRHYRVFQTVCQEMNMTKASQRLFISQPAISKTIQEIEDYYHVQLFRRSNKTLYLTTNGKRFYEYTCSILQMIDRVDQSMREGGKKEYIYVGASITTGTSLLSGIVASYCGVNPNVRIVATVDNTDLIERKLVDHKLDLAILEGESYRHSLTLEPLGTAEIVLVVNRMHPLYHQETVRLDDLKGQDFIVREEGSKTRERFEEEMKKYSIHWTPIWSCHNTQAIKNAVDAGLGIGVLSKLSVRKRLQSGQFRALEVFSENLSMPLNIAYEKGICKPIYVDQFKEFAIQHCRRMESEHDS